MAALVIVAGVLAGQQIATPNERVLQVVAAGVIVSRLRARLISALSVATLLLPFPGDVPTGTRTSRSCCSSLVWVFRVSTKREPPLPEPGSNSQFWDSSAYRIVYNVQPGRLDCVGAFLTPLTYVLVPSHRKHRPHDRGEKIVAMQLASVLVCLFASTSRATRAVIVPLDPAGATEGMTTSIRVGSVSRLRTVRRVRVHEPVLQLFLWIRATSQSRRWALTAVMLLTLFWLFSTVTRGPSSRFVGACAWSAQPAPLIVKLVGIVFLGGGDPRGDYIVPTLRTRFGDGTHVQHHVRKRHARYRAGAWKQAWGHPQSSDYRPRPYYAAQEGDDRMVAAQRILPRVIVGLVGLVFLWIRGNCGITCPRALARRRQLHRRPDNRHGSCGDVHGRSD